MIRGIGRGRYRGIGRRRYSGIERGDTEEEGGDDTEEKGGCSDTNNLVSDQTYQGSVQQNLTGQPFLFSLESPLNSPAKKGSGGTSGTRARIIIGRLSVSLTASLSSRFLYCILSLYG
jgi:hypothetical protein